MQGAPRAASRAEPTTWQVASLSPPHVGPDALKARPDAGPLAPAEGLPNAASVALQPAKRLSPRIQLGRQTLNTNITKCILKAQNCPL